MAKVIRRTFSTGSADVTFLNFTISGADLPKELADALAECDRAAGLARVVRQVYFLSPAADRRAVEQTVTKAYGKKGPVTSYVYEPPADGSPLSAELWAFGAGVRVKQMGHAAAAVTAGSEWGFVGGLETDESADPHPGVTATLKKADGELRKAGFEFHQLVRTWYYIGDLLAPLENGVRYDRFNQARNEFFQKIWKDLRYSPASTGIGMMTRRVAFEGIVLKGDPDAFKVTWIDNPLQTKPFAYDINVDQKRKPSFSRAAGVTVDKALIVFVSGTASIRKSEVVCADDVEAQTRITIENIAGLIGSENLVGTYGLPSGAHIRDIQQYRVYVKRAEDLDAARAACEKTLPDVPRVYLVADVCRPQCLVEIEAVAAVTV